LLTLSTAWIWWSKSLFDGHDAAINIMRRLIQAQGAEVIHLGHNRSVLDIVRAAWAPRPPGAPSSPAAPLRQASTHRGTVACSGTRRGPEHRQTTVW
jgi:hypothetical protein